MARALRQATRQAHQRLDHHPLLQQLIRPGLTRQAYGASLLALYQPHARLEACVAAGVARLGLDVEPEVPSPPRLALLAADLAALGLAVPAADGRALPVAASVATLAGQRYVLEGSRLGGQVIARHVVAALGASAPVTFFTAPGAGEHWQRLLGFLERRCSGGDVALAVAAAQAAFDDFQCSLGGAAHAAPVADTGP
ncbi:biliverdin-producing heme oxygenase [Halomonas sp. NO4]|uniref:biliverdin-producing heme oxygenase n=1 Tax=Halomonas sp. NO4 TaxID=2484813 RepID=UPI0013D3A0D8|nr:biliverdin-producing heme oxygenase [Halomonas sp. NO4]